MIPEHKLSEQLYESMVGLLDSQDRENNLFQEMRETLIKEGMIKQFPQTVSVKEMKYGVIDGACINETTQGMSSILLSAATVHDGYFTINQDRNDAPYVFSAGTRAYSKKNDKQNQTVMMLSELAVCGLLNDYDIRSMDGAYFTSLITLIRTLQEVKEYDHIDYVMEFMRGENKDAVWAGITALLNPPEDHRYIIGLAKSDTGDDFVRNYEDIIPVTLDHKAQGDKSFASKVLRPGEMFVPLSKNVGTQLENLAGQLVSGIEDLNDKNNPEGFNTFKDLVHAVYEAVEGNTLDSRVFTTYFCPTENSRQGKVLRLDYSVPRYTTVLEEDSLIHHAGEVIKVVNKDIVSPSYSEPYAQFKVDETCKRLVSGALERARGRLKASHGGTSAADNIIYRYRT